MRRMGSAVVAPEEIEALRHHTYEYDESSSVRLHEAKLEIINQYRTTEEYKRDVVELLRPEIQQQLGQLHDYRQLITQIIQNMNVLWEKRTPHQNVEHHLRSASHEEVAIYQAARLMESKLEAALFLMYPERVRDAAKVKTFRLHGLVLKYCRIYQRSFDLRQVKLTLTGTSTATVEANPDAVGVVIHTLLDNALKYAPTRSEVLVAFSESTHDVEVSVASLGPRISRDEEQQIFELFYRSPAAKKQVTEGTGFGLAAAAGELGVEINVKQDPSAVSAGMFRTRFSFSMVRSDS